MNFPSRHFFFRELSRYGRESYFPEKKDYNPNVNIEYVDDTGRLLNTKEVHKHCVNLKHFFFYPLAWMCAVTTMVIHSFIHSFFPSFIHSFIQRISGKGASIALLVLSECGGA